MGPVTCLFQLQQRLLRIVQEAGAGIGELHALGMPLEQWGANTRLKILDLPRQGWLGDVQCPGGRNDAAFFRDGDEVAQVARFYVAHALPVTL
ncbi:hypothetical protein CS8_023040 [Cupriavidus sp. 8B]